MLLPLLAIAALASFPSTADAAPLYATGSGWCESSQNCNNTDTNTITNHFAGEGASDYRNWFAFNMPTGSVSAASLFIWNDSQNVEATANTMYNLYAPSAISFSGLTAGGVSMGSIAGLTANTGVSQYIEIVLNSSGIAHLNANQGAQVLFGGAVTPVSDYAEMFGYTSGAPIAYLEFSSSVPEPGSIALLATGLAGLLVARKRAKK